MSRLREKWSTVREVATAIVFLWAMNSPRPRRSLADEIEEHGRRFRTEISRTISRP